MSPPTRCGAAPGGIAPSGVSPGEAVEAADFSREGESGIPKFVGWVSIIVPPRKVRHDARPQFASYRPGVAGVGILAAPIRIKLKQYSSKSGLSKSWQVLVTRLQSRSTQLPRRQIESRLHPERRGKTVPPTTRPMCRQGGRQGDCRTVLQIDTVEPLQQVAADHACRAALRESRSEFADFDEPAASASRADRKFRPLRPSQLSKNSTPHALARSLVGKR